MNPSSFRANKSAKHRLSDEAHREKSWTSRNHLHQLHSELALLVIYLVEAS